MRVVQNPQRQFGQVDIADIKIDLKSRDDIPHILLGLKHIYTEPKLHDEVFDILKKIRPKRRGKDLDKEERDQPADITKGRPGMEQWTILVLGVLRLGLNTDYDRVHELANQHQTVRKILGHGDWSDEKQYSLQSLKENLRLFTPEILDEINQAVIRSGHTLVKKSPNSGEIDIDKLDAKADSFVVKTDVHFPTDFNLLLDAIKTTIRESVVLAERFQLSGWRQHQYRYRTIKSQYRLIQKTRHSNSKKEEVKAAKEAELEEQCLIYLQQALDIRDQALKTFNEAEELGAMPIETARLVEFIGYLQMLEDQIYRRICLNEKIPHNEKIFSLYEPHTEWISKGKAGVPVELGLRVCIVEDQHRFVLHHQVMQQQTDDKIAVSITQETLHRYPSLRSMSFDKGFHSPSNQKELAAIIEQVTLPKKGRRNLSEQEREQNELFQQQRRQHSAVESAINALEHNGLDVCPDHGIEGFQRYISLAVVSRNIKRMGAIIRQQEIEKEQRRRGPYKKAA